MRRFLPELIDLIWTRRPTRAGCSTSLPLEQTADGYRAMDRRTAIKVLLQP